MAKRPTKEPEKPGKRRPKEEDYTVINLATLTRFSVFVRDVGYAEGPVSFRSYMKDRGAHRTMAITVDAIEALSKQLMLRRHVLDDQGRPTGHYTSDYADLEHVGTRRENGVSRHDGVTQHGVVWAEFGDLVHDLFQVMIEGGDDPDSLRAFVREMDKVSKETLKRLDERKSNSKNK